MATSTAATSTAATGWADPDGPRDGEKVAVAMTVERRVNLGTSESPQTLFVVRMGKNDASGVAVSIHRLAPWPDADQVAEIGAQHASRVAELEAELASTAAAGRQAEAEKAEKAKLVEVLRGIALTLDKADGDADTRLAAIRQAVEAIRPRLGARRRANEAQPGS